MVSSDFVFVAGTPVLDFLNTEIVREGKPADLLTTVERARAWLGESGIATRSALQTLRDAPPRTQETWLRDLLSLRGELRAIFSRLANGKPLRSADLRPLDRVLAASPGALHIEQNGDAPRVEFVPAAADPPFLLARATAEFLASADLTLIRQCAGENCVLFLYDTTKSHTRRWCSMATCGNRTKVKAHYQRQRDDR